MSSKYDIIYIKALLTFSSVENIANANYKNYLQIPFKNKRCHISLTAKKPKDANRNSIKILFLIDKIQIWHLKLINKQTAEIDKK